MAGEILLNRKIEEAICEEEEEGLLKTLEEKIGDLLREFQEIKEERDALTEALKGERERRVRMEKRLEFLSLEREKIKMRIDQLLHHLKVIEG